MTAKDLFLQNKELAKWWAGIANDTRFDQVMLHAAAITLEGCPSPDQRLGVIFLKEVLLTLSQPESGPPQFAQPGLKHELDLHRRTINDRTEAK